MTTNNQHDFLPATQTGDSENPLFPLALKVHRTELTKMFYEGTTIIIDFDFVVRLTDKLLYRWSEGWKLFTDEDHREFKEKFGKFLKAEF